MRIQHLHSNPPPAGSNLWLSPQQLHAHSHGPLDVGICTGQFMRAGRWVSQLVTTNFPCVHGVGQAGLSIVIFTSFEASCCPSKVWCSIFPLMGVPSVCQGSGLPGRLAGMLEPFLNEVTHKWPTEDTFTIWFDQFFACDFACCFDHLNANQQWLHCNKCLQPVIATHAIQTEKA